MIQNWIKWKEEYNKAWADYEKLWSFFDETLYDLFKKYPEHDTRKKIVAKVGLLGRAYFSGLERHSKKNLSGIADFFFNNRKSIDEVFSKLTVLREPLNEKKMLEIISLHGIFLEMLKKLTRDGNSVRSFASKYMHFHCNAVPIYDNIAASIIRKKDWYPLTNKNIRKFPMPRGADKTYYEYCLRFFAMYNDLRESGLDLSVKRLDKYLLWCAGK